MRSLLPIPEELKSSDPIAPSSPGTVKNNNPHLSLAELTPKMIAELAFTPATNPQQSPTYRYMKEQGLLNEEGAQDYINDAVVLAQKLKKKPNTTPAEFMGEVNGWINSKGGGDAEKIKGKVRTSLGSPEDLKAYLATDAPDDFLRKTNYGNFQSMPQLINANGFTFNQTSSKTVVDPKARGLKPIP